MIRQRLLLILVGAVVITGVITGLFALRWYSASFEPEVTQTASPAVNLGFTYLPVTQKVSDYLKLDVDSGALITHVVRGSPVDRAGMKAGDIILSFNGVPVGEASPLLGMMRSCPMGQDISMIIWSSEDTMEVTIGHLER